MKNRGGLLRFGEPWRTVANRGEPSRTVAVRPPHEPNRGVAVRFVGQTELWGLRTVWFVGEPHRAVRGSNRGQHYH